MFHSKCGSSIKILNDGKTAKRNASEFNFGLVFSKECLSSDELFEIRIEKKIDSWIGTLEIGVTTCNPENIVVPPSAADLKPETWLLSGKTMMKDCKVLTEFYPLNLEKLTEGETVGILRTSLGELEFHVNGVSFGVAASGIPLNVYAVINVYGKVAQVAVVPQLMPPLDSSEEGYCCASEVTLLPELTESATSPVQPSERLRFHERCGALVKLSANGRTAERLRPMDEFNNAVVISHRPLLPGQLFEIRMEKVVDKWCGSIEVGVTYHDPDILTFPATMTNMSSGTVMMSGCGILTNGKGSKRQYGMYNLDQLRLGDRIGMMVKPNRDLHYFINGMDQGIAASNIPPIVWAVVDLYGMAVKVTIVDRDQREEQNLITRRNVAMDNNSALALADLAEDERLAAGGERLLFHTNCGSHARVVNSGLTALRPNALDDFNNAVVLTSRPLSVDEIFEVRLEKMVSKWAGSIEVGVTTHGPTELDFPSTMTNVRSGTWIMTGPGVMHNGQSVIGDYGTNLDRLGAGDRVGLVVRAGGSLHFLVNGIDQGEAATGLPPVLFGVVDLYGQASQASIVAQCSSCAETPTGGPMCIERPPVDIHFHSVHGRNARVSNNGRTASRPRAMAEFNDAIVVTNRPLGKNEMFSVVVERIVDRWSGSIEAGVTAIPPNDLKLPGTMTDLEHDTWMLSGFAVMKDGVTLKHGYPLDLDKVVQGSVIGMMRHDEDATLHYYLDGVDMGPACGDIPRDVYPCIDLYGQCAQVSIVSSGGPPCATSPAEEAVSEPTPAPIINKIPTAITPTVHKLMVWRGDSVVKTDTLTREGSSAPLGWLRLTDWAEVMITERSPHLAGSLIVGVTAGPPPLPLQSLPKPTHYVIGGDLYGAGNELIKSGAFPSLDWLRPGNTVGLRLCTDSTIRLHINSIDQGVVAHNIKKPLYFVIQVCGSTSEVKVVSHSEDESPRRGGGEAPLASLDAESPPAAISPPETTRPEEAEGNSEKAVEDMEKSVEEGDKAADGDMLSSHSVLMTSSHPPPLRNQGILPR